MKIDTDTDIVNHPNSRYSVTIEVRLTTYVANWL